MTEGTGNGADTGPVGIADTWLPGLIGRPAFRVAWADTGQPLPQVLASGRLFAYARLPAEAVSRIAALEAAGFRVVDCGLTFLADPSSVPPATAATTVRDAGPEDRDAVAAIAASAFERSRFHLDPAFPKALADRIKAAWAANFFVGGRGDTMLVADAPDGRVAGFLQALRAGGRTVIDLIAVSRERRAAGLGRAMTAELARRAAFRGEMLAVGTQAANPRAARFYETLGFRLDACSIVLHYHAGGSYGMGAAA